MMITSITIENFRCFRTLTIDPIKRVNLIAGSNNMGKTAVLEALWMLGSSENHDITKYVTKFRANSNELTLEWLFYEKSTANCLQVKALDENGGAICYRLRSDSAGDMQRVAEQPATYDEHGANAYRANPAGILVAEVSQPSGECAGWSVSPSGGASSSRPDGFKPLRIVGFAAEAAQINIDDIDRLSSIINQSSDNALLPFLQILEPRLQRITIVTHNGNPYIAVDIGLNKSIPMIALGEGTLRVAKWLLGIMSAGGGIVLVDEIENGIHYSVIKRIWKVLALAATQADVQVFATTHSWECIIAAHEVFAESDFYDFALHRLDRMSDGNIKAVTYSKDALDASIEMGMEVRG